jgi:hypothetical protein
MSNVPQERTIQALLCSRLLRVHLQNADVHRVQFTGIHFFLFIGCLRYFPCAQPISFTLFCYQL